MRALAVLDAVAFPMLLGYWVTTWHDKGGFLGVVVITVLAWWGVRRLARSIISFDTYRWTTRHLVSLVLFGATLQIVSWLIR